MEKFQSFIKKLIYKFLKKYIKLITFKYGNFSYHSCIQQGLSIVKLLIENLKKNLIFVDDF